MSTTPLALTPYVIGDQDYVSHMNADQVNLQTAVNYLLTAVSAVNSSSSGSGALLTLALFGGGVPCLIGANSLQAAIVGTNVSVLAGYCWCPATQTLAVVPAATNLSGVGLVAGEYYVCLSATNVVSLQGVAAGSILYSVNWSGTAFSALSRVATIFMDASMQTSLLTSTEDAASYATLLARLEADETAIENLAVAPRVVAVPFTAPASGSLNFSVAHGVSNVVGASFTMTGAGSVSYQNPSLTFDGANLYLTASAFGVTGIALVVHN